MRISDWSSDVCPSDLMSFHNLGERGPHVTARSADWDAALTDAVTDTDPERRAERIAHWDRLPFARFAHPRERSEEHTSELQSLMRISYAVFCLKKKKYNLVPHIHPAST